MTVKTLRRGSGIPSNSSQCENGNMRVRLALAALVVCACAWAEQNMTVDQLLSFIRSSVKMKMPDKDVASYLAKVKLSEQLDERTVEELQGEGAGTKTVAALDALATASASLPKPQPTAPKPAYKPPPPPPPEEACVVAEAPADCADVFPAASNAATV